MFHLRVFIIGIHKKCQSKHYLLFLAIFHDLEMTQFWSVNNICLVYKLKFLLGNIYGRTIVFFGTFWRLWEFFGCGVLKFFEILYLSFFYPKSCKNCPKQLL